MSRKTAAVDRHQAYKTDDTDVVSYVLDRNVRADAVRAGARCVSSQVTVHRDDRPSDGAAVRPTLRRAVREMAENRARTLALEAWEDRWGPIPWDRVQADVSHLTWQTVYSLRVEPDEPIALRRG